MGKPLAVPKLLGIEWWWLLLAGVLEGVLRIYVKVPAWVPEISALWCFYQAGWLLAAEPKSKAFYLYLIGFVGGYAVNIVGTRFDSSNIWIALLSLFFSIFYLVAIFVFRSEIMRHFNETDPRGIHLGGVMTFFFSSLYFQYWFHQIYLEQNQPRLSITPPSQTDPENFA